MVVVAIRAEEIVASSKGLVIARHERLVTRGDESLQLDDYLEVLVKNPGALSASVPLDQARAQGAFSPTHDAYWKEACRQLGDRKGTRLLVEVLLAPHDPSTRCGYIGNTGCAGTL